jgi:hypothetical protein
MEFVITVLCGIILTNAGTCVETKYQTELALGYMIMRCPTI